MVIIVGNTISHANGRRCVSHATQTPTAAKTGHIIREGYIYFSVVVVPFVNNLVENSIFWGLYVAFPKTMTKKLITSLNRACDAIRASDPSKCKECVGVGWCSDCWATVSDGYFNAKIVGKIDNGGPNDGK